MWDGLETLDVALKLAFQVAGCLLEVKFMFHLGQALIDSIKLWRFLTLISSVLDNSNCIT